MIAFLKSTFQKNFLIDIALFILYFNKVYLKIYFYKKYITFVFSHEKYIKKGVFMENQHNSEKISQAIARYAKEGASVPPEKFLLQNPEIPGLWKDSLACIHSLFLKKHRNIGFLFFCMFLGMIVFFAGMQTREWMYRNSLSSLKVLEHRQNPGSESRLSLEIHFDRPMATPEQMDKETPLPLVDITPALPVQTLWNSDRTLLVLSTKAMTKATRYEISLKKEIQALDGSRLEKISPYYFHSTPLTLFSFHGERGYENEENSYYVNLAFDDEVSTQDLEKHLLLQDDLGRNLKVVSITKADGKEDRSRIYIKTNLLKNQKKLFVKILSGLRGKSGPLGIEKDVMKEFSVVLPQLLVEYVTPQSPSTEDCYMEMVFSHSIDAEDIASAISIKPEIPVHIYQKYSYSIKVTGNFIPGQSYCISLSKGMKSKRGYLLDKEFTRNILFPNRESLLRFASPGKILNLRGTQKIAMESMNCSGIVAKVYRVFPNNILHYMQHSSSGDNHSLYSEIIAQKELPVLPVKNELQKNTLSLPEILGENAGIGAYYLHIGDKTQSEQDGRFVMISDLGITLKKDAQALYCWVTSLSQGEVISQARVTLWSNKNQKLCESTSDESGLARIPLPQMPQGTVPFLVQVCRENDSNVLKIEEHPWNTVRFDIEGNKTSSAYRAFLYSDRGVYRPSEVVYLACAVRDANRQVPPSFPLELRLKRPDNVEIYHTLLKSNEQGMSEIVWPVPAEARTGIYEAIVQVPGAKEAMGRYSFQVENFMPDRYKLNIGIEGQECKAGDKVEVNLLGKHLHGAPASSRKVSYEAMLSCEKFQPKQYKDYTFGNPECHFAPFSLLKGEKVLGEDGKENFSLELPKRIKSSGIARMIVQGTLHETGGRSTTASHSALVYPYPVYLGVQQVKQEKASNRRSLDFQILAIDKDGNKQNLSSLEVKVYKTNWYWSRESHDEDGGYRYIQKNTEIHREERELPEGTAEYSFTPEDYGDYVLSLTDKQSGSSTTMQFSSWGNAAGSRKVEKEYLLLTLDKKEYKIGEKATIQIVSPLDGIALVCLEREKVFSTQVVKVQNGSASVSFPIEKEYIPNVYCTATVVKSTLKDPLYRAYGICSLPLNLGEKKIGMELSLPEKARPKDRVEVSLSLSLDGKPLSDAYITLAAVDEGICSLTQFKTPDPFACFYGKEALQVVSSDMYRQILAETPPGGDTAYLSNRRTKQPLSGKNKSVAIWIGGLKSDEEGKVKTFLTIPDYIGQIRFMAVAFCKDAFSSKQSSLSVTLPALLEVSTPRFAAWGDDFLVTASLRNQTGKTEQGILSLTASHGLRLTGEQRISQEIENTKESIYRFWVHCDEKSQEGNLSFQGSLGEEKLEKTISLMLRPSRSLVENVQIGSMASQGVHSVKTQGEWMSGTGEVSMTVSRKPLLSFGSSLEYLLGYPYGCLEQTTSRAFPLLYLQDILSLLPARNQKLQNKQDIPYYISAAIHRLMLMQTSEGCFSMWPGYDYSYPWGSVYAGHFLVEASKKGYEVPDHCMKDLLAWLRKKLSQNCDDRFDYEVRAYAAYVLACAEKIAYSDMAHIVEKKWDFSSLEAQFVYAAAAKLGKGVLASSLPIAKAQKQEEQETGGNLNSSARNQAIALLVALENTPDHPSLGNIVASLMESASQGCWANTQENSWALLALGKYFQNFSHEENNAFSGKIYHNNTLLAEFDGENDAKILFPCDQETSINIETSGKGFFYRLTSRGIPQSTMVQEKQQGITVKRYLLNEEGNPLEENTIQHGELVFLAIQIQGKSHYKNLALEQLLPAGMEAENPRLANTNQLERNFRGFRESLSQKTKSFGIRTLSLDHIEILDDRAYLFFDMNWEGNSILYLPLRAISPGTFSFPATQVSCMYSPNIQGNTSSSTLKIEE